MKKVLRFGLLAALMFVASVCSKKSEPDSSTPDSTGQVVTVEDTTSNNIKILQFDGYEITLTPQEDPGEIVNVKDLKNDRSFVVNEPNAWFFAVVDNFLILDVGTGAANRNVNVFDLNKNEKVFDSQYYSTFEVEDKAIRYRKQISIEDKSKQPKCPPEGNGFVEEHIFDLASMQDRTTGKIECVYFE
jgi:hypothetical protein